MTIETINIGAAPNDGTGDSLRAAMMKINQNFQETLKEYITWAAGDETTQQTADTTNSKLKFRIPHAITLEEVRASLSTAPAGADFTIDIQQNGTTIFGTSLSIDDGETTSTTATVQSILAVTDLPDDAELSVFVTQVGTTTAGAGLKITLIGHRTFPTV